MERMMITPDTRQGITGFVESDDSGEIRSPHENKVTVKKNNINDLETKINFRKLVNLEHNSNNVPGKKDGWKR